jgi:hypothetical protein
MTRYVVVNPKIYDFAIKFLELYILLCKIFKLLKYIIGKCLLELLV